MKNKILILILGMILLSSCFVSASENKIWFGRNESNPSQMIPVLLTSTGVLRTDMNFSVVDIWNTNIGQLSNVNATQFNNITNTLTIDTSWLSSFIGGAFFKTDGTSVMQGNANFGNNTIFNVSNISIEDFLNGVTSLKIGTPAEFFENITLGINKSINFLGDGLVGNSSLEWNSSIGVYEFLNGIRVGGAGNIIYADMGFVNIEDGISTMGFDANHNFKFNNVGGTSIDFIVDTTGGLNIDVDEDIVLNTDGAINLTAGANNDVFIKSGSGASVILETNDEAIRFRRTGGTGSVISEIPMSVATLLVATGDFSLTGDVTGNLIPSADDNNQLGKAGATDRRWKVFATTIFATDITVDNINLNGNTIDGGAALLLTASTVALISGNEATISVNGDITGTAKAGAGVSKAGGGLGAFFRIFKGDAGVVEDGGDGGRVEINGGAGGDGESSNGVFGNVFIAKDGGSLELGKTGTNIMIDEGGNMVFVGSGTGFPFAEIYSQNNTVETNITTSGKANRVQIAIDTKGLDNDMSADQGNDRLISIKNGTYSVLITMSVSSNTTNDDKLGFSVYNNTGSEFPNLHAHQVFTGGENKTESITISGFVRLGVIETLEVWGWNENDNDNFLVEDINLKAVMIGG